MIYLAGFGSFLAAVSGKLSTFHFDFSCLSAIYGPNEKDLRRVEWTKYDWRKVFGRIGKKSILCRRNLLLRKRHESARLRRLEYEPPYDRAV